MRNRRIRFLRGLFIYSQHRSADTRKASFEKFLGMQGTRILMDIFAWNQPKGVMTVKDFLRLGDLTSLMEEYCTRDVTDKSLEIN